MQNIIPYIPDEFEAIVNAVSDKIEAQLGFKVLYRDGNYEQAQKDTKDWESPDVLIWMPFGYDEDRSRCENKYYCDLRNLKMLIASISDVKMSNKQRKEQVFKPRLTPVYEALIFEIEHGENVFIDARHTRTDWGYWGGPVTMQANNPNLFNEKVDAIEISNFSTRVDFKNCTQ